MANNWANNWDRAGEAAGAMLGSPAQGLVRALAFVSTVFVAAVIGFILLGWSIGDAAYMVLLTLLTVFCFDVFSNAIRSRLIGRER